MPCLIAAPCSGSGKTLLSLCLAALARRRGLRLQPFKVGPDYLDPQLLSRVSGLACRNLDPLLCGEAWVERCFAWHCCRADLALVEGVMGLFDGLGPSSDGSSAAVAAQLGLPVVLVVEASRQAGSLAALVRGFRDHGPPPVHLAGVVLNRVGSARHHALLSEALAAIEVPLLGVLPSHPALELPSRHLGLLPPGEIADLAARSEVWAELAEQHLELDLLWPLLQPPAGRHAQDPIQSLLSAASEPGSAPLPLGGKPIPVAVASDAAFHFRYPEAGELLEACGLEPRPWSPLADEPLPPACRGVLLPGGYPELHAAQLAASGRSLGALRQAAAAGLPIVAECGGLLLLGQELCDGEGQPQPMAGVLPFCARRGELSLGYRQATALGDGLLLRRGERLWGHEFHRWQLQHAPDAAEPLWQLEGWGCPARPEGWRRAHVHASWLHLHWAGCPAIPARLAAAAAATPACQPGR
jgi:cobyrinic acid a,c-diamide synthase